MTRAVAALSLLAIIAFSVTFAAYRPFAPPSPSLSRYAPTGALLYLEAKDFSSLLSAWNSSPEKQKWVVSANYQVFSRSRLFIRLGGASDQFAVAAGLPPDMNFLSQIAGSQSALALYDIGNLQFLYLTRLASANAMQTALWQSRANFTSREVTGATFYVRTDPESEREVAFAVKDGFLLLATREDLIAGALQLMNGSHDQTVESESWFSRSTSAAGPAGDLRMVLNLEKLVPSPYFRSYWIQQNITDTRQYSAATSDLFLSGKQFREQRVLIRKSLAPELSAENVSAVADLSRLVPEDTGVFRITASPSPQDALAVLETKLLAPHLGPAIASQFAPQVALTSGVTGATSDLETLIDAAPVPVPVPGEVVDPADTSQSLKDLLQNHPAKAILQLQSTELDKGGVFVRIHSAVALLASSDWDETAVRSALVEFVRPALTASHLGLNWQQPKSSSNLQQLDGLWSFAVAVRGKVLIVSDDPNLLAAILARINQPTSAAPAVFIAGFNHAAERGRFARLTAQLDAQSSGGNIYAGSENTPPFFSRNIASLSSTFSELSSQKIIVRATPDKVLQTVTYEWHR